MKTKEPKNPDLGYKVEGEFDPVAKSVVLDMYIDQENSAAPYDFNPKYNISKQKTLLAKNINVILIFMTKINDTVGNPVGATSKGHQETIDIHRLPKYSFSSTADFDYSKDNGYALVILFHDNTYDPKDVQYFSRKARDFYDAAFNAPGQFIWKEIPSNNGSLPIRPRLAGMTIIRRKFTSSTGKLGK